MLHIRAVAYTGVSQEESLAVFGAVRSIDALRALAKQPGLSLVMASKVYRFCCPDVRAAVDRHSSYFFNSLPLQAEGGPVGNCTRFKREWANGNTGPAAWRLLQVPIARQISVNIVGRTFRRWRRLPRY